MKKLFIGLIIFLSVASLNAQVYKDSYALGFGVTVPRLIGSDAQGTDGNLGGHITVQANLSEHSNLRLGINGLIIKSGNKSFENQTFAGAVDFLYHFSPCESINPYIGLGLSGLYFTLKGANSDIQNKSYLDYQANFLFGVQWGILDDIIGKDFKVKTELAMHTVVDDIFDGVKGPVGGLFGPQYDNYFTFDFGLLYYFNQGHRSKYCDLYDGILSIRLSEDGKNAIVDYNKIEDLIKKYAPQATEVDYNKIEEIIKRNSANQAYVQAPGKTASGDTYAGKGNWVLLGINFDAGKSTFRPESFPILINAAQVLLINTDLKIEIQGHTDNVGSIEANKKLSVDRAEAVKRFLVAKGVDASRLSTVGFGATRPIADNKTQEGKAFNRRIEFKVIQ
ncbi:MAG: OmpA family protein [Ignavibacteria bacterium]|nr:OmpA family protein [Ignavibacteria bacterium]